MKKVLVIDDTSEIRMVIEETLNFYGFSTLVAQDGLEGVEVARRHMPDLIICDVNMPNLDGYGTLKAIREDELTAAIPFIFLSGATEKPNVRRGMELGADDYLTKPFTPSELLAAVTTRLEKQADLQRRSEKKLEQLRGNITLALPHELRTPLNGIMGLATILMEDCGSMEREDILESARYIHESALRLHRLIENFLVYAQIEIMASDPKSVELMTGTAFTRVESVVRDAARRVAEKYNRAADLHVDLPPYSVSVVAENLTKMVEEIVDNAAKFSSPGTPIQVTGKVVDCMYELAVVDQGRGMTPEQIVQIGPHVQFERRVYEQQGAGLGLIIARRLAELHAGGLSIESTPGVQTTVRILLPASSLNATAA